MHFIGRYFPLEDEARRLPAKRHVALAAVALYMDEAFRLAEQHGLAPEFLGWHSSHESPADYKLKWRDQTYEVDVLVHEGREFHIDIGGEKFDIEVVLVIEVLAQLKKLIREFNTYW